MTQCRCTKCDRVWNDSDDPRDDDSLVLLAEDDEVDECQPLPIYDGAIHRFPIMGCPVCKTDGYLIDQPARSLT